MTDPNPARSTPQSPGLFRSLVLDPALALARALGDRDLARAVDEVAGATSDRILTPLVTTALFLAQVLSDDSLLKKSPLELGAIIFPPPTVDFPRHDFEHHQIVMLCMPALGPGPFCGSPCKARDAAKMLRHLRAHARIFAACEATSGIIG